MNETRKKEIKRYMCRESKKDFLLEKCNFKISLLFTITS